MSRTYHHRKGKHFWRMVYNASLKKTMKLYYEDIYCKFKNSRRILNKIRRSRLKREFKKEIEKEGI